jgi:ABC-type transport system involved in multi-copper enzyme maturation permease subunit
MPARWGLGPVFAFEWLIASRRWQMYAVRALVVLVLLGALIIMWESMLRDRVRTQQALSFKDYGMVGEAFFYTVVGTQLALVLLAAPGAAAGAICLDKMRGTLLHVLVTDLSATEVVLGKLASRLIPVLGLVAGSVPVMMIGSLLGGLDFYAVSAAYSVMLGVSVFGVALALLLSVWGRKPHEVLLVVYLVEVLWLLAYPIGMAVEAMVFKTGAPLYWLRDLNPYALAFAPYLRPNTVDGDEYAVFLAVTFAAAAVCTGLAIVSVRPCALRYDAVTRKTKAPSVWVRRRWYRVLERNPLMWYERHRKRPSRWTLLVWGVYVFFAAGGAGLVLYEWISDWLSATPTGRLEGSVIMNMLMPTVGLLLVTVAAVTSMAEERVRGSLDVLLATPLRTSAIVWAKWRAAFRPIPWLLVLPAVLELLAVLLPRPTAAMPALPAGWVLTDAARSWAFLGLSLSLLLACGLFLTSLGLALATWMPRLSRAIACGVGLYVFQCLAWPFISIALFVGPNGDERMGPALLSPIFAGGFLTAMISEPYGPPHQFDGVFEWGMIWIVVLTTVSGLLYWLTLATFDRCMGRVPEHGMRRGRERKVKELAEVR